MTTNLFLGLHDNMGLEPCVGPLNIVCREFCFIIYLAIIFMLSLVASLTHFVQYFRNKVFIQMMSLQMTTCCAAILEILGHCIF